MPRAFLPVAAAVWSLPRGAHEQELKTDEASVPTTAERTNVRRSISRLFFSHGFRLFGHAIGLAPFSIIFNKAFSVTGPLLVGEGISPVWVCHVSFSELTMRYRCLAASGGLRIVSHQVSGLSSFGFRLSSYTLIARGRSFVPNGD